MRYTEGTLFKSWSVTPNRNPTGRLDFPNLIDFSTSDYLKGEPHVMPSFPLLDIAIGLIFIYLLLSLICSSLSEGLESFLRNRAIDLEAGVRNLLGDRPGSWWASFLPWVNSIRDESITRELYTHPLIRNLFRSEVKLPTYIPSRNFALALMDMTIKDGNLLRGATQNQAGLPANELEFVESINNIALPPNLQKSLVALVTAANGDAVQTRLNIESWFNSSMDRVSGWYKSRTQKILFCIGVVVTVLVNADSIAIFRYLSHSKNLQTIVGATGGFAGQNPPLSQDSQVQMKNAIEQLTALDIGIGWIGEVEQSTQLDRAKLPPTLDKKSCRAEQWPCEDPIGWSVHLLFLHGIGWLITAAAIALGAPFWFDTLNRFMVVRSTVKPKEKSPEEGSKDQTVE
jgi:hypothetical protein